MVSCRVRGSVLDWFRVLFSVEDSVRWFQYEILLNAPR